MQDEVGPETLVMSGTWCLRACSAICREEGIRVLSRNRADTDFLRGLRGLRMFDVEFFSETRIIYAFIKRTI